jgi:hypothetical protein
MEVQYTGHPETEVQVKITPGDLQELEEIIQRSFLEHIEFGVYDELSKNVLRDSNKARIIRFCERYNVDWKYTKDRMAFFKAVLESK